MLSSRCRFEYEKLKCFVFKFVFYDVKRKKNVFYFIPSNGYLLYNVFSYTYNVLGTPLN